ncbi:hypothetical protein SAMN02745157_0294 [Kaistia soli DSM 19436]|uniref:Uncharacterized protein n=1 Tax=Kaistia soli DSM 19436 TaxID=1122133 RepID=A0A1M4TYD9_9HYPH|nr:hypothetical protein [Kaistia soli]SHE49347.1 hypothetical protein SAMN02745157_0294 [Kaistia soli DSM 19436]
MKQTDTPFIDQMAEASPALKDARDAAVDHWAPEEVSSAVLLLALGHRLADEFKAGDAHAISSVFERIEHALAEGDADAQAAASAMIEAAVARAVDLGTWPEMRLMFGDKSAAHALNCMTLDR